MGFETSRLYVRVDNGRFIAGKTRNNEHKKYNRSNKYVEREYVVQCAAGCGESDRVKRMI